MIHWLEAALRSPEKRAMPILSFPCVSLMGITVRELISDSGLQALGMKAVADRTPSLASVSMMDLSVEAESFGSSVRVSDGEVPTVVGRILRGEEDARALRVPRVSEGRCALYVRAIEEASRLIEDRPVLAGCIGPYSLAGRLMDVSEIMLNCYDEPAMVHITMEKATEFIIDYINEFKRAGAAGVVMAEPLTGLLSPALAEEFSSPYVERICRAVRGGDFAFIYHNCGGNTPKMLDSLLKIGADAYHFGNSVDMAAIMETLPADAIAMGNLDPAGVLRAGTPQSVYEKTLEMLERLCVYPNYVPSTGCDIPPATPWANIDAFFRALSAFNAR